MTWPAGHALLDVTVDFAAPAGAERHLCWHSLATMRVHGSAVFQARLRPEKLLLRVRLASTVSSWVVSGRGELSYDVRRLDQHVLVNWSIPWPFSVAARENLVWLSFLVW
ncbi:MAG: hypothetical protein CMJ75_21185 [Planctomycetaceae bacterium]|nr:hypothetical protein [Planctomycetaceae bacterium]